MTVNSQGAAEIISDRSQSCATPPLPVEKAVRQDVRVSRIQFDDIIHVIAISLVDDIIKLRRIGGIVGGGVSRAPRDREAEQGAESTHSKMALRGRRAR